MTSSTFPDDPVTDENEAASRSLIPLSDPDITVEDIAAVEAVLRSSRLSNGPVVEAFEASFAAYVGRRYAIAVSSGTIGLLHILQASGIGAGDEVITSAHMYRETAHAITLAGARAVFCDIDYWSGTLAPSKIVALITEKTRAIVAANTNGHPAAWDEISEIAASRHLLLLEDSTEAIGSRYKGRLVGSFGLASVFDLSQPGPLVCGEAGIVVTDDVDLAVTIRRFRMHRPTERTSVVVTSSPCAQTSISDVTAALALAQLSRLDAILERRKLIEHLYFAHMKSFEGIKDPYQATDVTEIHWMLYVVHLGTRFSKSSRDAIVEDLGVENIEATPYSQPLHLQRLYFARGYRRGDLLVTEKVADRAVALPFHTHLDDDLVEFIVATMKDASVNVGAGAAIY